MESYLLDTSALSPLVDLGHNKHTTARAAVAALGSAPIYVSVLALAEMSYGVRLYEKSTGGILPHASAMIADAQRFPRLDVTRHTAAEYAELKSVLAVHYLPNVTRRYRKRHVEDWIDQFTNKALGVDDNDLWICAQALEVNFTVLRGDKKMDVIAAACPRLKLHLI